LLALPEDEFVHAFEQAFPTELGAIAQLHGRGGFPIRWLHAQRYWRANVALVGDSAHVIHPLAGQGVNLGLRDAQALAGHIAQAYDQGLPLAHARGLAAFSQGLYRAAWPTGRGARLGFSARTAWRMA
jgi:2-octaprenyl-3-methyl-6-methoxy-1,4-benzoquinol hydroxylase